LIKYIILMNSISSLKYIRLIKCISLIKIHYTDKTVLLIKWIVLHSNHYLSIAQSAFPDQDNAHKNLR
jgi:hypothetical protein